jgi:hypothetical protein
VEDAKDGFSLTLSTKISPNAIIELFRIIVSKFTVTYKIYIVYNEVSNFVE